MEFTYTITIDINPEQYAEENGGGPEADLVAIVLRNHLRVALFREIEGQPGILDVDVSAAS